MARMSKFQRSQRAHRRLMKQAAKNFGLVSDASKKFNYHSHVMSAQEKNGRVLSRQEKKALWNYVLPF